TSDRLAACANNSLNVTLPRRALAVVVKSIAQRGKVTFSELFAQAASRSEVVCTFLAMLELIRLKQLVCTQAEPFAEIEVRAAPANVAAVAAPTANEEAAPAESVPAASGAEQSSGGTPDSTLQAASNPESEAPTHGS